MKNAATWPSTRLHGVRLRLFSLFRAVCKGSRCSKSIRERKKGAMHSNRFSKAFFTFIAANARAVLVVSLLLALLSIFYTWQKMEFLTGRDDLMPKNTQFHADYRAYRQEFGDMEEIVVVIESDDQEKAARFGDLLYARLSGDKKDF